MAQVSVDELEKRIAALEDPFKGDNKTIAAYINERVFAGLVKALGVLSILVGLGLWYFVRQAAEDAAADVTAQRVAEELVEDEAFERAFGDVLLGPLQGAVVGFVSVEENRCPDGWDEYDAADGRFLLGAGATREQDERGQDLLDAEMEETGGVRSVLINENNLPQHQHAYNHPARSGVDIVREPDKPRGAGNFQIGDRTFVSESIGVYPSLGRTVEALTEPSGARRPESIEVINPFIAVQFCVKT